MDKNQSLRLAAVIFGVIALLHLIRAVFGWQAAIGNFNVPVYFSYIALIAAGCLSWHMYNTSRKS